MALFKSMAARGAAVAVLGASAVAAFFYFSQAATDPGDAGSGAAPTTLSADRSASARSGGRPGGPPGGGLGGFAPAISVALAKEERVAQKIEAIGETRALQSAALVAETAGQIDAVNFEPGSPVKAGDVLFQLDDEEQQIAYNRAKSQFALAKTSADRFTELAAQDSASALETEGALVELATTRAAMRTAEFNLQQRKVRAPFDGVAGLTQFEPGDYVRIGDTVTTIDSVSVSIVEFLVPQESLSYVEIGQPVVVDIAGIGKGFEGKITAIDSRVGIASRSVRIEATVAQGEKPFLSGASAMVTTIFEGAPAVSVPGLALQWDRSGPYVWVIAEDGSADRTRVSVVQRQDEIILVEGDLKPGDTVISESADRVRPGMRFPAYSRGGEGRARGTATAGAAN